jgi:hypothetical protein
MEVKQEGVLPLVLDGMVGREEGAEMIWVSWVDFGFREMSSHIALLRCVGGSLSRILAVRESRGEGSLAWVRLEGMLRGCQ